MLVEFSVSNYRSIRDRVTLSLVASADESHPSNYFKDVAGKHRLLKTAAIYGANASGKSNVIAALHTMRRVIRESHTAQRGEPIPVVPFRLDKQTANAPTEFEIVFIIDSARYVYGFAADRERIHGEWLTEAGLGGARVVPRNLFQRSLQPDGIAYRQEFGAHWKPAKTGIADDTLENQLFLSKFAQNNHPIAGRVLDWFRERLRSMSSEPEDAGELAYTASLCDKEEKTRERVQQMLRDADLGIEDFACRKVPRQESREWQRLPSSVRKRILKDMGERADPTVLQAILTKHQMTDGSGFAEFDLKRDESSGTQRFFSLAGPFIDSMRSGNILFCDELDSSLHPALSRALVRMVHQNTTTPFQFVFTTHDCSLLDADLLRRDQVWFTEKNKSMATDLYSLSDVKPRSGENFRKGYLNGRYGAIPFLGEFTF